MAKTLDRNSALRVAVDTGGTFTDCVWVNPRTRTLQMVKVFSTPADPSQAIAVALAKTGHDGPFLLLHGTTVGTNTLLQRKGARVAFVTTKGFEDSIQIGRQTRPKLYDFFVDPISPLVPPELRFGVEERTDKDGNILHRPDRLELDKLIATIRRQRPDSIALSLLFCFANPSNEKSVAAALAKLKKPLSVSHRILPEFREYERASTVVVNAYLQPVMESYLTGLKSRMDKWSQASRIFVMQSSGGLTSVAAASIEPVRTVLSGPAGGVVGAVAIAKSLGISKIIGFDMGGTSTDVCLVDGEISTTNEAEIAGIPVRVPMLNIHTVGAGGGSLARFDAAGALRVGPESAGAQPGPICYGRGTEPTVTDANVLLGRLPPDQFLGGEFQLDLKRTRRITREWLKTRQPRWSVEQFAEGVVRVVNANMEKAVRVVSIEKGYDPRDFTLIAFGGAGALHACSLAEELEIPRIVVPAMPGGLSALGILESDIVKDYSRTLLIPATADLPRATLKQEFDRLKKRALGDFEKEKWAGRIQFRTSVEMRYRGQGFELSLPYGTNSLAAFHTEHHRRYGYSSIGKKIELVTIRLRAWIVSQTFPTQREPRKSSLGTLAKPGREPEKPTLASAVFGGSTVMTKIMRRADHKTGATLSGPAIVTEYSATTVLPPGWVVRTDSNGNLILEQSKSGLRSQKNKAARRPPVFPFNRT